MRIVEIGKTNNRESWLCAPALWALLTACGASPVNGDAPPSDASLSPSVVGSGAPAPNAITPGETGPLGTSGPAATPSEPTNGSPGAVAPTGTATGTAPTAAPAPTVRAPLAARISRSEYAFSVLDVLGVQLSEEELSADGGGLPDDAGDGVFKRFADKQTTVEQHAAGFLALAQRVAERADVPALRDEYGECAMATLECALPVLEGVGQRLFRRPLDARELTTYSAVGQAALDAGEPLDETLRWVLTALLQAPPFLFHMLNETTGTQGAEQPLNAFELGARLASFAWNSVPDTTLLEAAADGSLTQPAVLGAQVQRLLQDPKAKRLTESFIRDYSRAERASFLGATDADRDALRESIVATFQYLTWENNRPLREMFTTTEFVVNRRTAQLLELPATGAELTRVDVSSLPERVGLLTHPGVIAGMGDQETGSFVNRGKFLMERLLCRHPAAVPAAFAAALEEFNADTTGLSEHERFALRKTRSECWGCHAQFEPFALGFSRFDGAGRYLGETDAAGKPLPLDGWVPVAAEADSPAYTNVAEYMTILQNEEVIQGCLLEHFLSYGTSYAPDAVTRSAARQLEEQFAIPSPTLEAMVRMVVESPLFQKFITQAPQTTTAGGGN